MISEKLSDFASVFWRVLVLIVTTVVLLGWPLLGFVIGWAWALSTWPFIIAAIIAGMVFGS